MTSTLNTKSTTTTVGYITEYTTDTSTFWITTLIIFIIIHIIAVLLVIWKIYLWCLLYPIDGSGVGAIFFGFIRMAFFIIESWTTVIFWFIFGACFYWFVFFKLQVSAYVLLPSLEESLFADNQMRFQIVFGIMTSLKVILNVMRVFF
jgi:RsiW-degrading membrane proteinase PrsW (M82 family)